ncbi:MAG: hypothetical protein AAFQ45_15335 [Pseudomonadota bacterium]
MSDVASNIAFAPARESGLSTRRRSDARAFQRMTWLAFAIFLPLAAIARLLPARWRPFASAAEPNRSFISDARAAAHLTVAFAFMR